MLSHSPLNFTHLLDMHLQITRSDSKKKRRVGRRFFAYEKSLSLTASVVSISSNAHTYSQSKVEGINVVQTQYRPDDDELRIMFFRVCVCVLYAIEK